MPHTLANLRRLTTKRSNQLRTALSALGNMHATLRSCAKRCVRATSIVGASGNQPLSRLRTGYLSKPAFPLHVLMRLPESMSYEVASA